MNGMEYIYAALLLHNSGKEITEERISAVMEAAGIEADMGRIKGLVSALNGVNIDEVISQAQPAYAPVTAVPQAQAQAQAPAEAPAAGEEEKRKEAEEKGKEEEEEEKAEETGMEGLASLFG
ncbi:MAG: 50S ribosomal protein P1 [Methanophagales archaeon]|nr:50S ribosomal protein P1 [Methanophagales archaeon]